MAAGWRAAMALAPDEAGRRAATAAWMRSISDTNRRTQVALRQLQAGRQEVATLEAAVRTADLGVAAARIRAEGAEAA